MKYLIIIMLFLSVVGCTEDNDISGVISEDIRGDIIGEWKITSCTEPGEIVPNIGAYTQSGLIFTESRISFISYHYADSECTDFEYETQSSLEDYIIGEQITSSSGEIGYEIDWINDLGDVYVTSYQIVTIINDQLVLGVPISYGDERAIEFDFDNIYNRISYDEEEQENQSLVYINDSSVQCEFEGVSEQETAQILIDYGVDVIESTCGYISGVAVATQCGLGDININVHLISDDKVIDAQNIGYELIATLENEEGLGYETIECQ